MNQNKINEINTEYEIILKLLKKTSHGRELSKEIKTSLTTVQRTLKDLEKKGVIDFTVSGRNKVYFIKKYLPAKKYVYNAENYKFTKLIAQYPNLEPLFSDIINQSTSHLIVLFGSYAKFRAKKESDIDIYIETSDKKIKKDIETINTRLSIKTGAFSTGSLLIKEIIKDHIIIKGVEQFYEKTGFCQ